MKLSLPLLVFTVFTATTVVAGKKKVTQSKKLRGDKNVLRNQDDELDTTVPSKVNSDRDLESTRIVGGTQADNGEYPYFGESVQSTRRLKCGFAFISSQKNRERPQK
jgi:hypothetical protein